MCNSKSIEDAGNEASWTTKTDLRNVEGQFETHENGPKKYVDIVLKKRASERYKVASLSYGTVYYLYLDTKESKDA